MSKVNFDLPEISSPVGGIVPFTPPLEKITNVPKEQTNKLNQEIVQSKKDWEAATLKRDNQLFEEYSKIREAQGNPLKYKNLENLKRLAEEEQTYSDFAMMGIGALSTDKPFEPPTQLTVDKETGDYKELDKHRSELEKYKKFKDNKERERFKGLSESLKEIEISNGGIYNESLGFRAFRDSFMSGISLGIYDPDHPVYGKEHIARNPGLALTGDIAGQTLGFMALNMAAGGLGLAEGLVNVAKGSETARKIVTASGYIPYQLSRWSNGLKATSRLAGAISSSVQAETIQAIGAHTLSNALIMDFGNTTRTIANRMRQEDKMTTGEWASTIAAPVTNFFEGLAFSISNSPSSWGARALASTLWEAAQQEVRILTKQQEGWDLASFGVNFLVGNIIGEGQGKIFSRMTPENKAELLLDEKRNEFFNRATQHPDYKKLELDEGDAMKMASILTMAEYDMNQKGIPVTGKMREKMVNDIYEPFSKLDDVNDQLKNGDMHKISFEELNTPLNKSEIQAINVIGDYLNWDTATKSAAHKADIFNNKKEFNKFISKDLISKESENNKIDGITSRSFQDGISQVKEEFVKNFNEGNLPKSQHEYVDILNKMDLFKVLNDETFTRIMARGDDLARVDKPKFTDDELIVADNVQKNIEAYGLRSKDKINEIISEALGRPADNRNVEDVMTLVGDKNIEYFANKIAQGKSQDEIFLDIINEAASRIKRGKGPFEDLSSTTFSQKERFDNEGEGPKRVGKANIKDPEGNNKKSLSERYETLANTPGRLGTDSQSEIIRSREFARLLEVGKESPKAALGSVFRYLTKYKKMNIKDIKLMLRSFDITDINELEIRSIIDGISGKLSKVDQRIYKNVPVKASKYTRDEINNIYDYGIKIKNGLNPVTGIKTDINSASIVRAANINGTYIFSLRKFYQDSLKKYGEVGANRILSKVATIIKNKISARSKDFNQFKDKSQLILRNPTENNSTDFYLFSEGLSKNEFDQIAGDLFNILNNRYPDNSAVDKDRFLIKFDDGSKVKSINATISFTDDISNPFDISSRLEGFKRLAAYFLNAKEMNGVDRMVLTLNNEKVRDAFNSINEIVRLNDAREIDSVSKDNLLKGLVLDVINESPSIPSTLPSIRQADVYADENNLLKDDPKYIQWRKAKIRSRIKVDFIEKEISDFAKTSEIFDENLNAAADEAGKANEVKFNLLAKNVIQAAEEFDSQQKNILNKAVDFLKSGANFIHSKTNVSQNDSIAMRRFVYMVQDAKERITKGPVAEITRAVYNDFVSKNFADDIEGTKKFDIFNRLQSFAREEEFKLLVKDTVNYEPADNIFNKLKEDIKYSEKKKFDISSFLNDPNLLSGKVAFDFKKAALDDLAFSKLIIQTTGISPEEYVKFMIRKDKIYHKELERLYNNQRNKLGMYKNLDVFENIEKSYEEEIIREIRNSPFFRQANSIDFSDPTKLKDLVNLSKQVGGKLETIVRQYLELDPNRISWITHRVIADPENVKIFKGEINNSVNGAGFSGKASLSPTLDEMSGRKIATLLNLIERGYKVELNTFEIEHATLNYLYSKEFNAELADNLKFKFINKMTSAYSRIAALEKSYIETKARFDINDRVKYDKLAEIIAQKDDAIADYMHFFADIGGYFYKPTNKEINQAKLLLTEIEESLDIERGRKVRNEEQISILNDNYKKIKRKINLLNFVRSVYSGERFVREKKDLIKFTTSSKEKSIKMKTEVQDRRKFEIENERKDFAKRLTDNLTAGEIFLPLDKASHISDANYRDAEKFKSLYDKIKLEHAGNRSGNIPLFEGLYIDVPSSRLFKQYIFRDDWGDNTNQHAFVKAILDKYDKLNLFQKLVGLYKPTVMFANNSVQALIAEPMNSWAFDNLKFAKNAYLDRDLRNSNKIEKMTTDLPEGYNVTPNEFYWGMNKNDLFSHGVSFNDVVSDSTRLWVEMMGKNDRFGFNETIREMYKKLEPNDTEADLNRKTWRFLRNTWTRVSTGYQKYQELAWASDEFVRLKVAKTMYDRYAKSMRADGSHLYTKSEAMFLAAEYTNLHMVQYSQVPSSTRRALNRFFMFPTYRIGTAKMYGGMFKSFGKGFTRLFGANPENLYKVSENRFAQAFYEMGPVLRTLGLTYAVKGIASIFFGYSYSNTWDFLTSYRLKKVKDTNDPFDRTMTYLSLGTPIFELEKYLTRDFKNTLLFNAAGVPRLLWSVYSNQNSITGEPIVRANAFGDPPKMMSQIAAYTFNTYFPFGSDYSMWGEHDLTYIQKLFNFSGLGAFYSADSPNKLMMDFNAAIDKAKTVKERKEAINTFNQGMKRTWKVLFNEEHKDIIEQMEMMRERIDNQRIN